MTRRPTTSEQEAEQRRGEIVDDLNHTRAVYRYVLTTEQIDTVADAIGAMQSWQFMTRKEKKGHKAPPTPASVAEAMFPESTPWRVIHRLLSLALDEARRIGLYSGTWSQQHYERQHDR